MNSLRGMQMKKKSIIRSPLGTHITKGRLIIIYFKYKTLKAQYDIQGVPTIIIVEPTTGKESKRWMTFDV